MRAKLDPMFYEYLLQVENGTKSITIADKVKLPIRNYSLRGWCYLL